MADNKGLVALLLGGLAAAVAIVAFKSAETIIQQMASIASVLVDVWVYRDGVWLVYSVPFPLTNTLDRILHGETAHIEVTDAVTLTYGEHSYPLEAGTNTIVWR